MASIPVLDLVDCMRLADTAAVKLYIQRSVLEGGCPGRRTRGHLQLLVAGHPSRFEGSGVVFSERWMQTHDDRMLWISEVLRVAPAGGMQFDLCRALAVGGPTWQGSLLRCCASGGDLASGFRWSA